MVEKAGQVTGADRLIDGVSRYGLAAYQGELSATAFINALAADYAYIRLRDVYNPIRFLRQMEGVPPLQLGTTGFRAELVDDPNPARHYMAFVFIGFWLPVPLAMLFLWLWEIAGFVRYGGVWSVKDMANGRVGVRHGRWVRTVDPVVLPSLIAADLAEPATSPDRA